VAGSLPERIVRILASEPTRLFTSPDIGRILGVTEDKLNDVRGALSRLSGMSNSGVKRTARGVYRHAETKRDGM